MLPMLRRQSMKFQSVMIYKNHVALPTNCQADPNQLEHLSVVFGDTKPEDIFALPTSSRRRGDTIEYIVFRVVALKPGNRQYLQRASGLSKDVPRLFTIFLLF